MTSPPLKLTERAAERLAILHNNEGKSFFRVKVDSGGCFGFQYVFSFEAKQDLSDTAINYKGAHVLIDDISLPFLKGAELDFQEEMIGARFVINNPQAQGACGCKSSFNIKI
jgi:iron-sulfur cluster assembly accessory protein